MKTFIFFLAFMTFYTQASCTLNGITIGVEITKKTVDEAIVSGEAVELKKGEHIYAIIDGEKTIFDIGTYEDDQRGNSTIQAVSSEKATFMQIDYDHETWHQGLDGFFTTPDQKIIDLNIFKECDSDLLYKFI